MSRVVLGPKPGTLVRFVPRFGGNDTAPDGDQVRVYIRAPSQSEKREHLVKVMERVTYEADAGGADKPRVAVKMAEVMARKEASVRTFVERVENYDGADGQPIETGAQLWEHGEWACSDEVSAEVESMLMLTDAAKKNSAEQLGSSPQATVPSPGIAANAGRCSSAAPVTATATAAIQSFATLS